MNRGMNIHKHQLDSSWVLTIPNWKLSTQCPWQPCFSEATKLRSDWPFAKPDGLRCRFLVEWACRGNTGRIMVGRGILANQMGIAPTKFCFFFWDLHKPMIPLITAPQYFEGVPLYVSTHPNGWIIIFSVRKYPHHSFLHSQILNGLSAKNWNPIPTSSRKCYVISVISHHYLSLLIILCYSMLHPQDPNFCWTSSPGGC